MDYRHEYKYPVTAGQCVCLETRLSQVLKRDSHAKGGRYTIRSLYFDDDRDSALWEKLDGVDPREKFRIRIYNGSRDYICLEKKCKHGEMTKKLQCRLTYDECQAILHSEIDVLRTQKDGLCYELYTKMQSGLRPKVLVEYDRVPFTYAPGNVRVTLDCNIRTGLSATELFEAVPMVSVSPFHVLEIKYDAYLPDIVRMLTAGVGTSRISVSKYALCRQYL